MIENGDGPYNGDTQACDTSKAQLVYRVPDGVGSSAIRKSVYKRAKRAQARMLLEVTASTSRLVYSYLEPESYLSVYTVGILFHVECCIRYTAMMFFNHTI